MPFPSGLGDKFSYSINFSKRKGIIRLLFILKDIYQDFVKYEKLRLEKRFLRVHQ